MPQNQPPQATGTTRSGGHREINTRARPSPAPHPSAAAAIRPARPVTPPRRPYPTAPDLTPPSPWPGPDYLGTGASRAGRPVIPSTVWLTPHPHLDGDGRDRPAGGERDHELWPSAVLAAILDAFSTAGTAVALLPWPARSPEPSPANPTAPDHTTGWLRSNASRDHGIAAALETIAAAGGRPILLPNLDSATTNRSGTNTPDPTPPDTAPPDTTPPDTTPPDTAGPVTVAPTATALAAMGDSASPIARDPQQPPGNDTLTRSQPAELIVTSVAPGDVDEASAARVALAAAHALRSGGLLLVLTHSDHDDEGRLVDPGGLLVTAAQNADLLYFQHVVAITTPVRNGHLHLPPATDLAAYRPLGRRLVRRRPADPRSRRHAGRIRRHLPGHAVDLGVDRTGRARQAAPAGTSRPLRLRPATHERIPTGPDLDLPTDPMLDLTKIGVPR